MQQDMMNLLLNRNIIFSDEIEKGKFGKVFDFDSFEKQTDTGVTNILFSNYEDLDTLSNEDLDSSKNKLIELKHMIEEGEEIYELYILFKNWEQERKSLNKLIESTNKASERKEINSIYNFILPLYSEMQDELCLEVDKDGINYLELENLDSSSNKFIEAKIFNVSMRELKKLFNMVGKDLFKQNVRIGIQNKKAGNELKEDFKNYLKVGVFKQINNDNRYTYMVEGMKEYFNLSDSVIRKFDPEIFWYKHNGINIFISNDALFDTSTHLVKIDPRNVSVINGAQTLTNMFIAKEELLNELESNDFKIEDIDIKMSKVLEHIKVKTIFIRGNDSLSKTITWGLNNQIPITKQDFVGVSSEVDDINQELKKYQIKILKTGEIEQVFTGLTPLEFIKLYYVAKGKPGKSKNFNKSKLESDMKNISIEILKDKSILKKIDIAIEVGKWWNLKNRSMKDKSLFLRYGKNYFQSFVIFKTSISDTNNYPLETDLSIFFEDLSTELSKSKVTINDYKSDEKFNEIISNMCEDKNENKSYQKNKETEKELTKFVIEKSKSNYSIAATIKQFNSKNNIDIIYFRTISIFEDEDRVKENFPLPNSTFEEFYKRDNYLEFNEVEEKYPEFSQSLLLKEIEKEYPVYLIYFDKERKITKVKFISKFSITMGKNWRNNAENAFNKVKLAFIKGDSKLFPKISSGIGFHIRPKAINSSDTFLFTDGKDITKRTFWVNSSFIEEIIAQIYKN